MRYYYAQLDDNSICTGLSDLSGPVEADNMVQLDTHDTSVQGKMWTGSGWTENPNPPEPQPEPVTLKSLQDKIDQLEQQNMALMMGMVDVYSAVTTNKGE